MRTRVIGSSLATCSKATAFGICRRRLDASRSAFYYEICVFSEFELHV